MQNAKFNHPLPPLFDKSTSDWQKNPCDYAITSR